MRGGGHLTPESLTDLDPAGLGPARSLVSTGRNTEGSHFPLKKPEPSTHPHGLVREPRFAGPVLAPGPQELFGLLFRHNRGGP